jgi:ATP-binding cassette subfamily B protein
MGQGMSTWHAVRSFRQDSSVTKKKLAPGTVKRIIKFAAPYKAWIIILLVLLVIDAARDPEPGHW